MKQYLAYTINFDGQPTINNNEYKNALENTQCGI